MDAIPTYLCAKIVREILERLFEMPCKVRVESAKDFVRVLDSFKNERHRFKEIPFDLKSIKPGDVFIFTFSDGPKNGQFFFVISIN